MLRLVPLVLLLVVTTPALALTPEQARVRVDHHLQHAEQLVGHFEMLLGMSCPQFPTTSAWDVYVDREADQMTLLMAHLEQAWVEAKRTGDDDVRRAAKAPRRHSDQMRQLMDKLTICAAANGAAFSPVDVWRRVERDVPRRQTEIALPQ
jgi:hypothetical protein